MPSNETKVFELTCDWEDAVRHGSAPKHGSAGAFTVTDDGLYSYGQRLAWWDGEAVCILHPQEVHPSVTTQRHYRAVRRRFTMYGSAELCRNVREVGGYNDPQTEKLCSIEGQRVMCRLLGEGPLGKVWSPIGFALSAYVHIVPPTGKPFVRYVPGPSDVDQYLAA